jgi:hypothetical protein
MTSDLDRQLLSEHYTNSIIKRHIVKLIKEGKSKKEIENILSEAGFFNSIGQGIGNMVQGAKNLKQNYWDDPRAIKAGQKAGYGLQGQEARSKGQTAYNRQTTRKFQNEIAKTMKSLDKTVDKSIYAINKNIFKTVNDLFGMIKEEGPNVDGNFLAQQFELVYNSLNAGMSRSTGALQQNYSNIINQLKAMGGSLMGGMQQQQPQQQVQQQPQQQAQQAPAQQQQTPRANLAGAYQNQNVAGTFAQPNAQINASTEVRIYKKDYVLMESAYEEVLNKR